MVDKATIRIYRFDYLVDAEPRYKTYEVPPEGWRGLKVIDTLRYIYENLDSGLCFRESCRQQLCGACTVMINKKPALACDAFPEREMIIDPLPNHPVLKDLIIDLSSGKGQ